MYDKQSISALTDIFGPGIGLDTSLKSLETGCRGTCHSRNVSWVFRLFENVIYQPVDMFLKMFFKFWSHKRAHLSKPIEKPNYVSMVAPVKDIDV